MANRRNLGTKQGRAVQSGIRLGRLFGVEIRADYSLAVIFTLVAVSLGAGLLPSWHPEWGAGIIWGVAIAAAVLFFASILVHEMSHALVARAFKLSVRSIRLFIFGGVADIEHEPDTPRAEAMIAIVGPITSIALGVAFTALGASLAGPAAAASTDPVEIARAMGPVSTTLAWLGPINILIGAFNMLPGFPMDGGRVLRAVLWKATGDFYRATRWASYSGQFIAWLLMAAGIMMVFGFQIPFFGTGLVGGVWLVLIGWFLSSAAAMHRGQVEVQRALKDTPVARIMRRDLPSPVRASESISGFVDGWVMGTAETAFIVTDEGRVLGVVRPEDVRRVPQDSWNQTSVVEITTHRDELETTTADEDAFEALKRLRSNPGNVMLVMDGDTLVGLLRLEEITRWLEIQPGAGAPRSVEQSSSRSERDSAAGSAGTRPPSSLRPGASS